MNDRRLLKRRSTDRWLSNRAIGVCILVVVGIGWLLLSGCANPLEMKHDEEWCQVKGGTYEVCPK